MTAHQHAKRVWSQTPELTFMLDDFEWHPEINLLLMKRHHFAFGHFPVRIWVVGRYDTVHYNIFNHDKKSYSVEYKATGFPQLIMYYA